MKTPPVLIEVAGLEDIGDILEVQKLAYQSQALLYDYFEMPPMIESEEELKEEFTRYLVLKAVANGRIVGSIRARMVDGETCYLGRLSVHPELQDRGIGRALMVEAESRFPQARRFTLFTGSRSTKNIAMYESLGYRTTRSEPLSNGVALLHMEKSRIAP